MSKELSMIRLALGVCVLTALFVCVSLAVGGVVLAFSKDGDSVLFLLGSTIFGLASVPTASVHSDVTKDERR